MLQQLSSLASRRLSGLRGRRLALNALRLAPWVVLGPITGFMSEAAVAAFKKRRPFLGLLYVLLNVGILAGMPLLTAALLARGR
jgi:hypothetical protein